jgi:hypothetical protein
MTIPTQDDPIDLAEAARTWRKRAEALWKLSRYLDDLAVRLRNMALQCDQEAAACDDLAVQRPTSVPRSESVAVRRES